MTTELKERWIAALKSGKYPKTKSQMCDGTGYCCLGVLADLDDPDGWEGEDLSSSLLWHDCYYEPRDTDYQRWGLPIPTACDLMRLNDASDTFGPVIEEIERSV